MRPFASILFVPLALAAGANLVLSQPAETPQRSAPRPFLTTCDTTEPSPRIASLRIPPDLAAAERELRARLKTDPTDVSSQFDLGTLFEIAGDFPAALISYQEALKLDPSCSDCVVTLSSLLHHCKQNEDSIRVAEEFLQANPRSSAVITHLALIQIEQQHFKEGLELAHQAQKMDRDSAIGYHLAGMAHLGLNRLNDAERDFKAALERDEALAESHLQLGRLYARQPETFDPAALHLRKAIDLGLVHPEVHKDLGRVLVSLEKHLDAIEQLQKALNMNPDYAEPYYFLSKSYAKVGQEEQSEAALTRFRALEKAQGSPSENHTRARLHYMDGMGLLQQQNLSGASAAFLKAIELDETLDPAYFRLAQLHAMSGATRETVKWVGKAIAINPVRPEYHLLLADSLPGTEVDQAIESVKEAIRLNPSAANAFNSLGNVQFSDGRYGDAIQSYRQAIKLDDENAIFHLNLSAALRESGDEAGSKRERELYLRLSEGQGR